jgi:hypothetical protein
LLVRWRFPGPSAVSTSRTRFALVRNFSLTSVAVAVSCAVNCILPRDGTKRKHTDPGSWYLGSICSIEKFRRRDVRRGVFCCSMVFSPCSICLILFVFYRHFPPNITSVAPWVATFLVFVLVFRMRFSGGYIFLLFTLLDPFT